MIHTVGDGRGCRKVFVDGVEITLCVQANESEGWAEFYITYREIVEESGKETYRLGVDHLGTYKRMYGTVKVVFV